MLWRDLGDQRFALLKLQFNGPDTWVLLVTSSVLISISPRRFTKRVLPFLSGAHAQRRFQFKLGHAHRSPAACSQWFRVPFQCGQRCASALCSHASLNRTRSRCRHVSALRYRDASALRPHARLVRIRRDSREHMVKPGRARWRRVFCSSRSAGTSRLCSLSLRHATTTDKRSARGIPTALDRQRTWQGTLHPTCAPCRRERVWPTTLTCTTRSLASPSGSRLTSTLSVDPVHRLGIVSAIPSVGCSAPAADARTGGPASEPANRLR